MDTALPKKKYSGPNQKSDTLYNPPQGISMELGFVMIILAVCGLFDPNFFGLQLSLMHCYVLAGAGVLAVWSGLTKKKKKPTLINMGLGVFFIINAIAGFLLGGPGTPSVGYDAPDELLFRIAPGFLELSTADHTLHLFLGLFFFMDVYLWKRYRKKHAY